MECSMWVSGFHPPFFPWWWPLQDLPGSTSMLVSCRTAEPHHPSPIPMNGSPLMASRVDWSHHISKSAVVRRTWHMQYLGSHVHSLSRSKTWQIQKYCSDFIVHNRACALWNLSPQIRKDTEAWNMRHIPEWRKTEIIAWAYAHEAWMA